MREVKLEDSLAVKRPDLVEEWNVDKNGQLTPFDYTVGSNHKAWWLCSKNPSHEWEAIIWSRTSGNGCPYCSGNKVREDNCLATVNPTLSEEWHPFKNGDLTPFEYTACSNVKIWWKCIKNPKHEWEAVIANRKNGAGCPYCSGRKVSVETCLMTVNPVIAKEWHPAKNDKTPYDYTAGSGVKVWWQCSQGHEWEIRICYRTRGSGCPYCSGYKLHSDNCLANINPELAKEWHPTKNGKLTIFDVFPNSTKKVCWLCSKNKEHSWFATVNSRHGSQSACPQCSPKSSFPEQAIFFYIQKVFKNASNRYQYEIKGYKRKVELDIFIPEINVGIEYDGYLFHKDKPEKDEVKNEKFMKIITLIRVRENGLPIIEHYNSLSIKRENNASIESLEMVIRQIFSILLEKTNSQSIEYSRIKDSSFNIKKDKQSILENMDFLSLEKSLETLNPELAKEWHPTRNGNLKTINVTPNSNREVWWLCSKGHEWDAKISNRSISKGCPYCSGRKTRIKSELAKEWHPTLNGTLLPSQVTSGSNRKVWWLCSEGHEWDASIQVRSNGYGKCSICSKKVYSGRELLITNPELAKEWHSTLNGTLLPSQVTSGSNRKVWWLCSKGHEWEASITSRNESRVGCQKCRSLAIVNPELAKEWHPTKNDKTPYDYTAGSGMKAWWQCSQGHEWKNRICDRTRGYGKCRECKKLKTNEKINEDCLQFLKTKSFL